MGCTQGHNQKNNLRSYRMELRKKGQTLNQTSMGGYKQPSSLGEYIQSFKPEKSPQNNIKSDQKHTRPSSLNTKIRVIKSK